MRSTPTQIFWWKHGVNVSVLRQTGLQSLSRGSDNTTQGDTWEFAPCFCIQGFNLLQLVLGTTQRTSTIITWIKTFGGWVRGNFICGNLRAFFFYPSLEGAAGNSVACPGIVWWSQPPSPNPNAECQAGLPFSLSFARDRTYNPPIFSMDPLPQGQ